MQRGLTRARMHVRVFMKFEKPHCDIDGSGVRPKSASELHIAAGCVYGQCLAVLKQLMHDSRSEQALCTMSCSTASPGCP